MNPEFSFQECRLELADTPESFESHFGQVERMELGLGGPGGQHPPRSQRKLGFVSDYLCSSRYAIQARKG